MMMKMKIDDFLCIYRDSITTQEFWNFYNWNFENLLENGPPIPY